MNNLQDMKQVTLTGSAATELTGGKKERKKRSTGGSSRSVPIAVPAPVSAPAPTPAPSVAHSTRIPLPPSTRLTGGDAISSLQPIPSLPPSSESNSNKVIKVELKKNNQTKRVQLQPKKEANTPLKGGGKRSSAQTKKSRKVTLGVVSLHKRMNRAKKMTRKVKEMSLPQLREHLIQKKLIKTTSKAPESVLRQIAADAQIVAGKAL